MLDTIIRIADTALLLLECAKPYYFDLLVNLAPVFKLYNILVFHVAAAEMRSLGADHGCGGARRPPRLCQTEHAHRLAAALLPDAGASSYP